jgi:hypothetical protein
MRRGDRLGALGYGVCLCRERGTKDVRQGAGGRRRGIWCWGIIACRLRHRALQGKYIVYGLGTFSSCIANPSDKDTFEFSSRSVVTEDGVEDGGIRVIPWLHVVQRGREHAQPEVLTGTDAERVNAKIKMYSQQFQFPAQID